MTYSQRHKDIDPDVTPSGFALVLDDDNPNAPNDAFVIGADMEQVRAPDANSYVDQEAGPKPWVKPVALVLALAGACRPNADDLDTKAARGAVDDDVAFAGCRGYDRP